MQISAAQQSAVCCAAFQQAFIIIAQDSWLAKADTPDLGMHFRQCCCCSRHVSSHLVSSARTSADVTMLGTILLPTHTTLCFRASCLALILIPFWPPFWPLVLQPPHMLFLDPSSPPPACPTLPCRIFIPCQQQWSKPVLAHAVALMYWLAPGRCGYSCSTRVRLTS